MKITFFTILFSLFSCTLFAQVEQVINPRKPRTRPVQQQTTNQNPDDPAVKKNGPRRDTLGFEHRDDRKDSISITYRYLDSTRRITLDSSINDFSKYFPVPSTWQYLGNNGAAAYPLVFEPVMKAGFDAGFHAFDIYKYTVEGSKIYKTSKPFSALSYQLASGKEQMLTALHTQNPRPNLNVGFDYRLISAPGFFVTQNTNHSNFRLFTNYQGKRKRYNGTFLVVGNVIRASENGGIQNDTLLADPNRKDRFSVPVNLGAKSTYNTNPFVTTISTGNTYRDFNFLLRQSYDLGKRDSIAINDSTTEFLFYPKLRIQHTFSTSSYKYNYRDVIPDSITYRNWYDITIDPKDSFTRSETWKILSNDISLIQYPDTKNTSQFILAGATLQNIKGTLHTGEISNYNIIVHGEYRNRTRNKLWDVVLKGELYLNGFDAGDYNIYGTISRNLNRKFGDVSIFFNNVNRTPSFVFDNRSSFNLGNSNNFNKENITSFGATASNPLFTVGFRNYLITNYSYFTDYYHTAQYSKPINLIQVSASKKFRLYKRWNYYAEATLQQTDGAAPVNVPLLFTRSRLAFEGKFFKNLILSTGLEARYYTPFKAPDYSPVLGQFVPQNTHIVKNLPDIHAFVHYRIKGFAGYIRAENLNTVSFQNGFGFINNNFAAPHYPTQGFLLRFAIQWWFVN